MTQLTRSVTITIFLLIFVSITSGCAVLTKNQINAVNRFANVADDFSKTPSEAIKAWAELQLAASAAEVTSMRNSDAMWDHIDTSFKTYSQITKTSQKALQAFAILDKYAALLKSLTADKYTKELNANAKASGEALDSAVDFYNTRFNTSLSIFGDTAAAIIRGAGGLYIRQKQGEALKIAVKEAKPTIDYLTREIENISDIADLGIDKELETLETEIQSALKFAPRIKDDGFEQIIIPDLASYVRSFELIMKGKQAKQTVQQTKDAASQYRKVHDKLVKSTREKIDSVDELIQKIDALQAAIKAE
jgi:hypothetical protein